MRFGLFGTGPWAHQAHAPGLAAHPGVEFAGVWGRNLDKAAELAGAYGAKAYTDVGALIADVEAVAIALPPDAQAPIALRAARAGRHLLLDKPVAFTAAQAAPIVAAVEERDLASAVFFTRRFLPPIEEFVDAAVAQGGWIEGRVDQVTSIFTPGNPFGASPWRRTRGGLWDVGPHALALVLPILGPVSEVAAMIGRGDMTYVLARHADGAMSTFTLSVDAPAGATREEAIFTGDGGVRAVPVVPWEPVRAYGRAIDDLLAAAAGGPKSKMDAQFGAAVTAVLEAAAEAAESGRTVPVGGR